MTGTTWMLAVSALAGGPTLDLAPERITSMTQPDVAAFVEASNDAVRAATYGADPLSFERWYDALPDAEPPAKRISSVNGVPYGADLPASTCVEVVSPDGQRAVIGSWSDEKCAIQLVDAPDGVLRRRDLGDVRHPGLRRASAAWSPDGGKLRILVEDRTVDIDVGALTIREARAPRGAWWTTWLDATTTAAVGERAGDWALWVADGEGWTALETGDQAFPADPWVGRDGGALLVLREDDDGGTRIVRVDPADPRLAGAQVAVAADAAHRIEAAKRVGERLLVVRRRDGILRLERTSMAGEEVEALGVTATEDLAFAGWIDGDARVRGRGIEGPREWRVGASGAPVALSGGERALTVETVYAQAEGATVPITLVSGPEPAADAPLWVSVYGGFGIANEVEDDDLMLAWIRGGGRWATVHVRGGDERGPEWHTAATGVHKIRTVEDLNAAVAHLHAAGLGVPGRTALWGDSNGGLVAAAAVARRPELYGAVVAGVGPHDLVDATKLGEEPDFSIGTHVTSSTAARGSASVWWRGPEYPNGPSAAEKAAAVALSPVHTVPAGPLPPVLLYTGGVDPVVNPLHSVRLAAAWDELPGARPLLRVHDTWTHARAPGDCGFGYSSAMWQIREEAFVFVLRTFDLVPPLPEAPRVPDAAPAADAPGALPVHLGRIFPHKTVVPRYR